MQLIPATQIVSAAHGIDWAIYTEPRGAAVHIAIGQNPPKRYADATAAIAALTRNHTPGQDAALDEMLAELRRMK